MSHEGGLIIEQCHCDGILGSNICCIFQRGVRYVAGMACHETALGPIFLYRLVAHLVLVQSLPADCAPSVRPDGVLLEPEPSDAQLDARARPRAILHSTMVHGESNVIQSNRRRHVCGFFLKPSIPVLLSNKIH